MSTAPLSVRVFASVWEIKGERKSRTWSRRVLAHKPQEFFDNVFKDSHRKHKEIDDAILETSNNRRFLPHQISLHSISSEPIQKVCGRREDGNAHPFLSPRKR